MSRAAAEFVLIRHAPPRSEGRLCGRTDIPCDLPTGAELDAIRAQAGDVHKVITSPALRCRDTAAALFPDRTTEEDPRLWEQDFGSWDGIPYSELPDLGPLTGPQLVAHRPPGGESFADVVTRVRPVLDRIEGRVVLVVHAGVVRAAVATVTGAPAALAFDVQPLSISCVNRLVSGDHTISCTNWRPS